MLGTPTVGTDVETISKKTKGIIVISFVSILCAKTALCEGSLASFVCACDPLFLLVLVGYWRDRHDPNQFNGAVGLPAKAQKGTRELSIKRGAIELYEFATA